MASASRRRLIRLREQRHGFDLLRLLDDERRQKRDRFLVFVGCDVEPAQHHRHNRMCVVARFFETGDRALRVGPAIGVARSRQLRHPRQQRAENPVRFWTLRVRVQRSLAGREGIGGPIHARVELGQRRRNLGRLRVELVRALIRSGRARIVAGTLEMHAHQEFVVSAAACVRDAPALRRAGRDGEYHYEYEGMAFLHRGSIVPFCYVWTFSSRRAIHGTRC